MHKIKKGGFLGIGAKEVECSGIPHRVGTPMESLGRLLWISLSNQNIMEVSAPVSQLYLCDTCHQRTSVRVPESDADLRRLGLLEFLRPSF